jgi:hypothetical protein
MKIRSDAILISTLVFFMVILATSLLFKDRELNLLRTGLVPAVSPWQFESVNKIIIQPVSAWPCKAADMPYKKGGYVVLGRNLKFDGSNLWINPHTHLYLEPPIELSSNLVIEIEKLKTSYQVIHGEFKPDKHTIITPIPKGWIKVKF